MPIDEEFLEESYIDIGGKEVIFKVKDLVRRVKKLEKEVKDKDE